MINANSILPEMLYNTENLNFNDVEEALLSNKTIVGRVQSLSEDTQELLVEIGDNLIAFLPFNEVTIYPLTYSKKYSEPHSPLQVTSLKNKIICTKVKEIINGKIILSRKENMIEAYTSIKNEKMLPFNVTSINKTSVFGDVGYGIHAKIHISDLCKCRIRSATEICNVGDCFYVSVMDFDEFQRVNVSYKETFPKYDPTVFKAGDIITGTVNEAINSPNTGHYINIAPQVSGILDHKSWHPTLQYGDTVECIISKVSPKGLHLKLVQVLTTK